MSELLLELFSEEIPARMQKRASEDLARMIGDALKAAGVEASATRAFATPRRLTLVVDGLPDKTPDVKEERKGPKVGAPQQAIDGFLRAAGLTSIDQAQVQDDKKGAFYIALTEKKGRPTADLIAEIVPQVVRDFPWPKSMRSGRHELRWVRPLHSIICLLDGAVVPLEIDGIKSGNTTRGHRFMAPQSFTVTSFADYEDKLRKAFVVLDAGERARLIHEGALKLAADAGLKLFEDEGLLHEVAGLVEWPVPLLGKIDDQFMEVPQEVLTSTMRANQKYFALTDATGKLAPRFIVIANLVAEDGGKAIVNGNERVLRARFSDARFLWEQDKKQTLSSRLPKLEEVKFYEGLGNMLAKAHRISNLARLIAAFFKYDETADAELAGLLAKADLSTGMVSEFPELQGLMGAYYARNDRLGEDVALAIAEHYSPIGPSDSIPNSRLGQIVALADKLDTLAGFWIIDEKPTGSKDPYALRRAALGVIRIALEAKTWLPLRALIQISIVMNVIYIENLKTLEVGEIVDLAREKLRESALDIEVRSAKQKGLLSPDSIRRMQHSEVLDSLLAFFADRLKVYLRDRGMRHDLVDAVFALPGQDDLVIIVKRVEALSDFLGSDDGKNLLAGYKRAVNILRIEEKKDGVTYEGAPDASLLVEPEEKTLAQAVTTATVAAAKAVDAEDFIAAMAALAKLRAPVYAFFENKITVNADDAKIRANRLRLLSQIRNSLHTVADFSKIEG